MNATSKRLPLRRLTRKSSFSSNVASNYIGRLWEAAISIAFAPLYIHYLGPEAYGIVGLITVLQTFMLVLDFGMTPTLTRESARFQAGEHDILHLRDLIRSIEFVVLAIGLSVVAVLADGASLVAHGWVRAETLSPEVIANVLTVGGMLIAVRLFESIYRGTLLGLQRQVLCNTIGALFATVRGVGAVLLLALGGAELHGFIVWQLVASLLTVGAMAAAVYLALPRSGRSGQFSVSALRSIGGFAGGVLLITIVALAASQADKLLLSRILPLGAFGHYMFAINVALVLEFIALPIVTAVQPRLVALAGTGESEAASRLFHRCARVICLLTAPGAALLIGFSPTILILWSGDAELTRNTGLLLSIFAVGTFIRAQCILPYYLQLSHGWTRLTLWSYAVTLCVTVAALLLFVPRYGAVGGAWIWTASTGIYFLALPIMFRRLLPGEATRFYLVDIAVPAGAVLAGTAAARLLTADFSDSILGQAATLTLAGALAFGGAGLAWLMTNRFGSRASQIPVPTR